MLNSTGKQLDEQKSIRLKAAEYNYLLPVPSMKSRMLCRRFKEREDEYYFIGTDEEIEDMRNRLMGL